MYKVAIEFAGLKVGAVLTNVPAEYLNELIKDGLITEVKNTKAKK
jgi:hypothetical protein